jgi:uncharacterized protein with FMN-binding domain
MSNMNMCKDGIYTASASYYVPRGSNTISVNITIKNDIITAVTSDDKYSDGTSAEYIDSFKSELSSAVVGKSITGLNISRVGGASLTSDGFNKTLDIIRTDAAV